MEPTETDFVIGQGDTLPILKIPIPANSDGQMIDLAGCTVNFMARKKGTQPDIAPIILPMESSAAVTYNGEPVIMVSIHFTAAATTDPAVAIDAGATYAEMEGELEIIDATGEVLTIPTIGYMRWFIRGDIGNGA